VAGFTVGERVRLLLIGEDKIDRQGKLWFGVGMAMIVIGIFAFSGILELVVAVSGVLVASQGRKRRA
jgi:hypothetical protein